MYEFIVGFVFGIGTVWLRKSRTYDVACQVNPPPLTKPVSIPRKRMTGIPELAHFWDVQEQRPAASIFQESEGLMDTRRARTSSVRAGRGGVGGRGTGSVAKRETSSGLFQNFLASSNADVNPVHVRIHVFSAWDARTIWGDTGTGTKNAKRTLNRVQYIITHYGRKVSKSSASSSN
jgi:hypothetical protein